MKDKALVVKVLKAELYDMRHKKSHLELRVTNLEEAIELTLDRIDRIQTGDSE